MVLINVLNYPLLSGDELNSSLPHPPFRMKPGKN